MSKRAKRRYRKKMREYYNAEYNIGVFLDKLTSALDECTNEFEDFPRVYKEESDLYGNVMDNFNSRSTTYGLQINAVLQEAAVKKQRIEKNKIRAHERYEHYKRLYENEDDDDD